jgi:hypothetical protein
MPLRHKLRVYSGAWTRAEFGRRLWYVECEGCPDTRDWLETAPVSFIGPAGYYGRDTWEQVLEVGIAHQVDHDSSLSSKDCTGCQTYRDARIMGYCRDPFEANKWVKE